MNTLKYNLYYLESQFVGFPLVIRVTIFLITILAIIYLASLLRIFFLARTRSKMDNREKEIQEKYENKLKTILFSDDNIKPEEIRNKLGLNNEQLNNWEKSFVTKLIIKLIKQNEKLELNSK